jgi:hypothetical protein
MSLPGTSKKKLVVGNDAGWVLTFHKEEGGKVVEKPELELDRGDYYAEIDATLPGGLEGGSYTFVIEGLTDKHYAIIRQRGDKRVRVVRLYLFWRDTNQSLAGLAANLGGLTDVLSATRGKADPQFLVAELAITGVKRQVGQRRYEAVIEARERVFERLATTKYAQFTEEKKPQDYENGLEAAKRIAEAVVPVEKAYPLEAGVKSRAKKVAPEPGYFAVDTLRKLGKDLEVLTQKRGRGLFLIRDGKLHIGVRPIPLTGEPIDVTARTGLIEAVPQTSEATDPNAAVTKTDKPLKEEEKPPKRDVFVLTLKGRPDIKPGDVVRFNPAPEDEGEKVAGSPFGAIGDLLQGPLIPSLGDEKVGDKAVSLYVTGVQHKLGRTKGFVTTVNGVAITKGQEWDVYSDPPGREDESRTTKSGSGGDSGERAAGAVEKLIRREIEARRLPEVGEVRGMVSKTDQDDEEPPRQTLTVWQGLEGSDGNPNAARLLPIRRKNIWQARGVPYASLFAWGKCGLVLPRYPGTRVLLAYRNGDPNDPVEIGALWESGQGPDAKPGDYWLILPAAAPDPRDAVNETVTPQPYTGKVTQDLIDADGNRIIEVGQLTIRIGKDTLNLAGARPGDVVKEEAITIEHAGKGTRIIVKTDGTLILESAENIEIATEKDLNISAKNVNITVSGKVDIS